MKEQSYPGRNDIPPSDSPSANSHYDSHFWQKVDDLFYATMDRARTAFRANLAINIIIVMVGLVLIGIAIYSSLTKGTDLSSTALAGLGTADLVATFFANPQKGIQKDVNNLVSIQILYRSYLAGFEYLADVERRLDQGQQLTIGEVEKINANLSKITTDITTAINALTAQQN